MTQTAENPFIDPLLKKAWAKGYDAAYLACMQKEEEIARLRKVLHSGRALLSIMQDRDSNLESLLSMITEALKQ